MDTAQWPQEMVVKPMGEIVVQNTCSKPSSSSASSSLERRVMRPQKEQALNCPRCSSINTKFCYYNNYSLTQPRYFCKTCRRYWTAGGSLRNIPVGGGSRKNKKSSPSSASSSSSSSGNTSSKKLPNLAAPPNPRILNHEAHDLNLGFQSSNDLKTISELIQVPDFDDPSKAQLPGQAQLSALELLNGLTNRGLNSFATIPDSNAGYPAGFSLPEFKVPSLGFSLEGVGSTGGYGGGLQESGRVFFPFEELKVSSSTAQGHSDDNGDRNGDSNGYWSGMIGTGSW